MSIIDECMRRLSGHIQTKDPDDILVLNDIRADPSGCFYPSHIKVNFDQK